MKRVFIHSLAFCILAAVFYMTAHEVLAQRGPVAAELTGPTPQGQGWWATAKDWLSNPIFTIVKLLSLAWLALFGWLVGMAGMLLNFSVETLVIGMGGLVRNGGFGASIDTLWRLIRDLVNIVFVFSLIYIGIATIIGIHGHNVKSALRSVIVAALLVNFSLFFAKATIDVSNIVADSIYRKMVNGAEARRVDLGVSAAFMDKMGVMPLLIGGSDKQQQDILASALAGNENGGGIPFLIVYTVGATVLLFALAISFAFGAFMLIGRFVILLLLMITSPVAFLPKDIPFLGGYSKQWWDTLLSQAFLAPVYFFGLYLALLVVEGGSTLITQRGSDGLAGLFVATSTEKTISVLLFYLIGIFLINAATLTAKKMSNAGAAKMVNAGAWAGKMMGASLAVGGYLGRGAGGRIGNRLAHSAKLSEMASSKNFATRNLARLTRAGAIKAKDGSWDARGSTSYGKMAGLMGVDAGKASTTSYTKWMADKKKKELEYAEHLNQEHTPEIHELEVELKGGKNHDGVEVVGLEQLEKNAQEAVRLARLGKGTKADGTPRTGPADQKEIARLQQEATDAKNAVLEQKGKIAEEKTRYQRAYVDNVLRSKSRTNDSWTWFPFMTRAENKAVADHVEDAAKKKKKEASEEKTAKQLAQEAIKEAKAAKDAAKSGGGGATAHPPADAHAGDAHPPADAHAGDAHPPAH